MDLIHSAHSEPTRSEPTRKHGAKHMSATQRLKQENCEFEASLGKAGNIGLLISPALSYRTTELVNNGWVSGVVSPS